MARLFDHLVGGGEQRRRHGDAQRPGGLGINDQLEFGRLHDRQIGRLCALENAAGIDADLTMSVCYACPITDQPSDFGRYEISGRLYNPLNCHAQCAGRLKELRFEVGRELIAALSERRHIGVV